jgi:hypothetical protein
MASALMMGIFGAVLTHWLGAHYFAFEGIDSLWAVGASNVAGFFSLLLTLWLERRKAISRIFMSNALGAWAVLVVLDTFFLCALDPMLRTLPTLAVLFLPLVFATGFMLPLWGPTQDGLIRFEYQLKKRSAKKSANQEFSRPERDAIRLES